MKEVISIVTTLADHVRVFVRTTVPDETCICTQATTNPIVAVKIARRGGHVQIREGLAALDCE